MSRTPAPPNGPATSAPDADRDAWLSEALRHAPDADVSPPPALSEMILREAQAKARPPVPQRARPAPPFWSRWWVWMAQPSVGAGLASVMVAGLVGVMMWDRPLEENSPRSSPVVAPAPEIAKTLPASTAPSTAPDTPAARDLAAAPEPHAQTHSPPIEARLKQAAPTTPDRPSDAPVATDAKGLEKGETQRRNAQAERAEESKSADKLAARPDALAKAARTAEAMSPAAPAVDAQPFPASPSPMAAAPPPPSPMPAPVVATPSPPPSQSVTPFGVATAPAVPKREASNTVAGAAAGSTAPARPTNDVLAESTERSFDTLRAALASESGQWSWQRNGGPLHPVDDALSGFLADIDAVAAGRWQSARPALAADRASDTNSMRSKDLASSGRSPAGADVVRLLRDGRAVHTLRIDTGTLRWDRMDAQGAGLLAAETPLDGVQSQRMRRALDKLGP